MSWCTSVGYQILEIAQFARKLNSILLQRNQRRVDRQEELLLVDFPVRFVNCELHGSLHLAKAHVGS